MSVSTQPLRDVAAGDKVPSRRRRAWNGYWVVASVVVGLTASLAFVAGRVASPAQRASAAQAPPTAVLTMPVHWGPIQDSVVLRATAGFASTRRISVFATGSSGLSIVTKVTIKAGARLQPGSQLAEISGEPLFGLTSPFGPYRDLSLGAVGPDVEVVQANLRGFRLPVGQKGRLDSRTAEGVRRLLRRMGYGPAAQSQATDPAAAGAEGAPAPSIVLPAHYWVAISGSGETVANVGLRVGQNLGDGAGALEVTSGTKIVRLEDGADEVRRFAPGMRATFTPDGGKPVSGVLSRQAYAEQQAGTAGSQAWLLPMPGLDAVAAGTTGRLEVFVVATPPVLSVPVTALRSQPDGSVVVRIQQGDDTKDVPVQVGAQARGNVAITGAGVNKDDLVVLP